MHAEGLRAMIRVMFRPPQMPNRNEIAEWSERKRAGGSLDIGKRSACGAIEKNAVPGPAGAAAHGGAQLLCVVQPTNAHDPLKALKLVQSQSPSTPNTHGPV
jgi:hypothetical protein